MKHRNRIFLLFAIAVLSLIIASCTPPGKAPVINSFTVDEATITAGSEATLSWSIRGATSAEITPGIGSVAITTGNQTVKPAKTTTYVLRASNTHGSAAKEVTVTVIPVVGPVVTSITVSPANPTVTVGDTRSFTAAVEGSGDFDSSVTWSSSNPAVATIDDEGVATTLSEGTTTITATSVQTPEVTGTAQLSVTEEPVEPEVTSVAVVPAEATINVGDDLQFEAAVDGNGTFDDSVTWSSSDPAVATVDATTGLVTAVAVGTATITATSAQSPAVKGTATVEVTAVPVVTSVTVEPATVTVPVGETRQLTARVEGNGDFDRSVAWASSDEDVAVVNEEGLVTGVAQGTATITATSSQAASVSGSAAVTVPGSIVSACTDPEELVTFPDPLVDREVRALFGLGTNGPITCEDVQRDITSVTERGQEIANALIINRSSVPNKVTSLEGIQHLINLRRLELEGNGLSDISLLAGLTELVELNLDSNEIIDLTPLENLTKLEVLGFYDNLVEDVSPLSGLTNLKILYASFNRIRNVAPLATLVNLEHLWLLVNCREIVNYIGTDCLEKIDELSGLSGLEVLLIAGNDISDISAVAGLTDLQMLDATANDIQDISALGSLANLRTVRLVDNPIHSLKALADNAAFTGPRPVYHFNRSGVTLPINSADTFHNLDLGFNCLLDEPENDDYIAEMVDRELLVSDPGNQNVRAGCDSYPGLDPAGFSSTSRQAVPSVRQQVLKDLLGR